MKFTLIIPTKDRQHILNKGLEKLSQVNDLDDLEVFIINDSDQQLILKSEFGFAKVYKNPGKGVASARNFGASKASHPFLIFMDDDVLVQKDTFQKIKKIFPSFSKDCLNPNWIYPDFIYKQKNISPFIRFLIHYGFDTMKGWSKSPNWNDKEIFVEDGGASFFLVIAKERFIAINGYNENFPHAGFEDYEFFQRLKKAGVKTYVDPNNLVYHNEEDRIEVENWLERKKRDAQTRRVGVALGYNHLQPDYPGLKKLAYKTIYNFRRPLLNSLKNWRNHSSRDSLYFKLVNLLLGSFYYEGYTGKQVQETLKNKNLA